MYLQDHRSSNSNYWRRNHMLAPILSLLNLAEVKTIIIIILSTRQDNTPFSILVQLWDGLWCPWKPEDPEGPIRSFTLASSPTEENFILISTRIRDTPFKKKLDSLDVGISVKLTAPLGKFVLHEDHRMI